MLVLVQTPLQEPVEMEYALMWVQWQLPAQAVHVQVQVQGR